MLANGLSTLYLFPKAYEKTIFSGLVEELANAPDISSHCLVYVLEALGRGPLPACHLSAGFTLLTALNAGHQPDNRGDITSSLWVVTLFHLAISQDGSDPNREEQLSAMYRYFCRLYEQIGEKDKDETQDQWHLSFVKDYWQKEVDPNGSLPGITTSDTCISQLQQSIYQRLQRTLLGRTLEMEVPVNGFPVDIMIDGHICIEVDGPQHYVTVSQEAFSHFVANTQCDSQQAKALPGLPLMKDRFVDFMLERYGYRVFRMPYTKENDEAYLKDIFDQISAALPEKDERAFVHDGGLRSQ